MYEQIMNSLHVILGPMFSGKTTYLVKLYNQLALDGVSVAVINYIDDKRYHESLLSTHDHVTIPCIFTKHIRDLIETDNVKNSTVVLINEGQFFTDLYDCVNSLLVHGKTVYVCGLDGDFKQQKFGQILDLIPICDKVVKLTAICHICKGDAIFSHRLSEELDQVVIGSSNYVPLCRSCYCRV